jgi:hypothetical protein
MAKVRDTVQIRIAKPSDVPTYKSRLPKSAADHLPKAVIKTVNPLALNIALRLAGGSYSRLRFNADGSITVTNKPRKK